MVGRKSWQIRGLLAVLYTVLTLGAVTMVYPFLMMFSASVESQYDISSFDIVPRYLHTTPALFGKYAEDKYKGDITAINSAYGTSFATLTDVTPPAPGDAARLKDWDAFVRDLPARYKQAGFGGDTGAYSPSPLLDRYQDFLTRRFHGDIAALDRAYTEEDATILTVFPPFEQPSKRSWTPDGSAKSRDWAEFERTLPVHYFLVIGADPLYQQWLKEDAYAKVSDLNAAWGTQRKDFSGIPLPAVPTGNAAQRRDWETFVRTKLPFRQVVVAASALPAYQGFLQGRYKSDLASYDKAYGTQVTAWAQITLPDPEAIPASGPPLLDWLDFLKSAAPLASLSADTAETRYRARMQQQGGLTAAQAATLPLPISQADWAYVQAHTGALRWDFLTRNYALVMQYLGLHGNGIWVTVVYCVLAVLAAVVINPLCAYALARYNLSYGNGVLLFVLATMAFPAEVAMIPNFLLLKHLSLLNTFWALVLPGAASGYSIFLLKGFFDSLPRELYEAGTLDGASEMRMFTAITLPLSKPIFAVIALGAFTASYGAFMFAMTICQDRSMWTLMVWLYEMQTNGAPEYVMMAALTLVAIPTLLVFLLAQNTIMKGIILPSYK
jgi:ABC-type glycerol-3-phosphate transport system permease component